jgi:membrane-bound metal-dependent hydrolase YbcI (DUF457 family)
VDPVSHAAFGCLIARSARAPMPRLAIAASIGALAPDLDSVLMPFGWDLYLRAHETGTHTLIGSVPLACAAAVVARGRSRLPLAALLQIAWLGVISHLFLDVVSGARIRLFSPFGHIRTMVPLVAMAEPWVLGICLLGVAAMAVGRMRARPTATLAVSIIALSLAVKGVWLAQALHTLPPNAAVRARIVEAQWASLRQWNVFTRTDTGLTWTSIAPARPPRTRDEWPIASDFPLAQRSRELTVVQNLRTTHELTFAREVRTGDGSLLVLWSDIRFCWRPSGTNEAQRGPLALGSGPAQVACALWVGGTYDPSGHPINQRVQVFGVWQTRPAPQ